MQGNTMDWIHSAQYQYRMLSTYKQAQAHECIFCALGRQCFEFPPGALSLVYHGEALPSWSQGFQAPVARHKQSDHSQASAHQHMLRRMHVCCYSCAATPEQTSKHETTMHS